MNKLISFGAGEWRVMIGFCTLDIPRTNFTL